MSGEHMCHDTLLRLPEELSTADNSPDQLEGELALSDLAQTASRDVRS